VGCLTYKGVGTLEPVFGNIVSEKYIECLDQNLWPVIARNFQEGGYIFQEDNAPLHTSRKTTLWKNYNNIRCMSWSSQSPDINIIENFWRTFKIKLENKKHLINTQQNLIDYVKKICYDPPPPPQFTIFKVCIVMI
jgi:hypothetical protein